MEREVKLAMADILFIEMLIVADRREWKITEKVLTYIMDGP